MAIGTTNIRIDDRFQIKDENIFIYEIDPDDVDLSQLTEVQQQELATQRDQFIADQVIPRLRERAFPCNCQMPVIQKKSMTRAKLLNLAPGSIGIEQDDIDQKDFSVYIRMEDGKYAEIVAIMAHCKGCGAISLYGDGNIISGALGTVIFNQMTRFPQTIGEEGEAKDANYTLEDLETGEVTSADSLSEILGMDGAADTLETEDVDAAEEKVEQTDNDIKV